MLPVGEYALREEGLRAAGIRVRVLGLGLVAGQRGLGLGEGGAIGTRIDLEEQVARAHVAALGEAHAHDLAAGLGLQGDGLVGLDGGHGVEAVGHAPEPGLGHGHGHGGRAAARALRGAGRAQAAGGERGQGEEEAATS